MCSGCVRQVRGVYESVRSRVLICRYVPNSADNKEKKRVGRNERTYIAGSTFDTFVVDLDEINSLF